ncbi:MAG TPA: HipA domain-containing protein [Chitinophagaceae bacterium]|nr:HipA domain-containing protein [Chitinophagaceae bacterium]
MNNKCLYCYNPLLDNGQADFHEHCSLEFFGEKTAPIMPYMLDQMADLAKNVVERSIAVPGVQPKISLSLVHDALSDGNKARLTVVGAPGGNYIFKFPSVRFSEMPQNEHVTMRIAEAFGIKTVPSSLIRMASGELSFITKRIDRTVLGEKIHMLDMFQITEASDKYRSSLENIGKVLDKCSANTLLDKLYFFEITVFSFLTGNNDMHLKNFSMINNREEWILSPAYDLLNVTIINPEDDEELALTLEGKKKKLNRAHFEQLGKKLDLTGKQISNVFKRFASNRPIAEEWVQKSFLSDNHKELYTQLLAERYARIS